LLFAGAILDLDPATDLVLVRQHRDLPQTDRLQCFQHDVLGVAAVTGGLPPSALWALQQQLAGWVFRVLATHVADSVVYPGVFVFLGLHYKSIANLIKESSTPYSAARLGISSRAWRVWHPGFATPI
jgi:hypothetical protein